MDAAEESLASVGRAENPVHGGIGEDFVVICRLKLGSGGQLGGIEDCLCQMSGTRKEYKGKRRWEEYLQMCRFLRSWDQLLPFSSKLQS